MFVVGVVSFTLVAATAGWRINPARDVVRDLRTLRDAIDAVDAKQAGASLPDASFVESLLDRASQLPVHEAESEFLAGSYYFFLSQSKQAAGASRSGSDANTDDPFATRANAHLSRALMLTVPDRDLPPLLYRLGLTQHRQGQNRVHALNLVRQGLELGIDDPAPGYAFLIDSYLNMTPPDLTAALSASERQRETIGDGQIDALGQARCLHAEILVRLDRTADALRELEQIDPRVSDPVRARCRLLQARCSEREQLWPAAAQIWTELETLADHVPGGRQRVAYERGLALSRLEPANDAVIVPLWKQAIADGGDVAQAAGIRLGHRLIVGTNPDVDEALQTWTAALAPVRAPSDFKNSVIDSATTIELFDQACERLVAGREFSRARTLANLESRLTPPGVGEEKSARVSMKWGEDLSRQAEATPAAEAALVSEARSHFQDAADGFKQAALHRDAAARLELTWASATCYRRARDFTNAALVLEKLVALPQPVERRAEAHFALAEAYQAQSQTAPARAHFLKCIELNRPPYVYRALAKLAQAEIDAKNFDTAREILLQIVTRNGPDLERDLLETATFSLGKVLFDLGEADEGAVRYREAVRQFPDNPNVWKARERLADHHWDRAKQIAVPEVHLLPPERRPIAEALLLKRRAALQDAHDAYEALARDLQNRHRAEALPMELVVLWRNSLFNVGSVKIDMGEYADALQYCRSIQRLYKGKAESLFAARQVYFCWRQIAVMPGDRSAYQSLTLEVIQTALRDLDEIPPNLDEEVFLSGPTPFSRDQWRHVLRQWEADLQHVTLRANPRTFAPQD